MPFLYGFDPLYFVILAPGLLLSLWATIKVRSTFSRYSEVPSHRGLTGAQAAAELLRRGGVRDVRIEPSGGGALSDHYDPSHRVLRLSPGVYDGSSVAAVAVAAHEAGHALQHADRYAPMALRTAAVPVVNIGSSLSWVLIAAGMMLGATARGAAEAGYAQYAPMLLWAGVIGFSTVVFFQVVTLPVELNASARARDKLLALGIIAPSEERQVAAVLRAAAMTYVAAALTSILTLLYYLIRLGVIGGRRSD